MNFENIRRNFKQFFKERNIVKFVASFGMVFGLILISSIACVFVYAIDITPNESKTVKAVSGSSSEIAITSVSKVTTSITTTKITTSVTSISSSTKVTTTKKTEVKKTVNKLALEVINGKWGIGEDRKEKLTKSGYNYDKVQAKVNEILDCPDKTITTTEENSYNEDSYDTSDETEENSSSDYDYDSDETETSSSSSNNSSYGTTYVTTFSKGTCYAYGYQCTGGSGRSLIDCSWGDGTVRGSVASSFIYNNYGYYSNGGRTMVYLEVNGYPSMSGYYYVDDCNSFDHPEIVDFYFNDYYNCDFYYQGVIFDIDCYLVN